MTIVICRIAALDKGGECKMKQKKQISHFRTFSTTLVFILMAVISIGGGFLLDLKTGLFSYLMPMIVIGIGLVYYKQMT